MKTLDPIVSALIDRRKQVCASQRLTARAMGFSGASAIAEHETGDHIPRLDRVRQWADALGCDLVLVPRVNPSWIAAASHAEPGPRTTGT